MGNFSESFPVQFLEFFVFLQIIMKLILSFCLCVLAFSKSLEDKNEELRRTNKLLLKTLREVALGEEKQVGQTNVISTCAPMTGYKVCTGPKHELANSQYARRGTGRSTWWEENEQITPGVLNDRMPLEDWCKLKCQNMGIDGCCEWQDNTDRKKQRCYFSAFQSSTISDPDNTKRKLWGEGFDYEWIPERFASICSVSNCAEYQMEKLNGRTGGCDYDNVDSKGRMAKGGPGHSPEECDKWCESKPECVFNSRTSNGYCHGFKTCNYEPKGTGIVTKQKVCKGALEYNNHDNCEDFLDEKYCIEPPKSSVHGGRNDGNTDLLFKNWNRPY